MISRFDGCFLTLRGFGTINAFQGISGLSVSAAAQLLGIEPAWNLVLPAIVVNLGIAAISFVFTDKIAVSLCRRSEQSDLKLSVGLGGVLIMASTLPSLMGDWAVHQSSMRAGLGASLFRSPTPALFAIGVLMVALMPWFTEIRWKDWLRRLDPHD